ncbi:unnamed protein product [Orchesella dallaii]|uniref:Uncharacterized protein n=1 Tax=Orchesella dallaii TaxID=48710 RepID=A0ABP1S166_9HEXA
MKGTPYFNRRSITERNAGRECMVVPNDSEDEAESLPESAEDMWSTVTGNKLIDPSYITSRGFKTRLKKTGWSFAKFAKLLRQRQPNLLREWREKFASSNSKPIMFNEADLFKRMKTRGRNAKPDAPAVATVSPEVASASTLAHARSTTEEPVPGCSSHKSSYRLSHDAVASNGFEDDEFLESEDGNSSIVTQDTLACDGDSFLDELISGFDITGTLISENCSPMLFDQGPGPQITDTLSGSREVNKETGEAREGVMEGNPTPSMSTRPPNAVSASASMTSADTVLQEVDITSTCDPSKLSRPFDEVKYYENRATNPILSLPSGYGAQHPFRVLNDNEWRKIILYKLKRLPIKLDEAEEGEWREMLLCCQIETTKAPMQVKRDFFRYAAPRIMQLTDYNRERVRLEMNEMNEFSATAIYHSLEEISWDGIRATIIRLLDEGTLATIKMSLDFWISMFVAALWMKHAGFFQTTNEHLAEARKTLSSNLNSK